MEHPDDVDDYGERACSSKEERDTKRSGRIWIVYEWKCEYIIIDTRYDVKGLRRSDEGLKRFFLVDRSTGFGDFEAVLSGIQDLLDFPQRMVVFAFAFEDLYLLLHENLDIA